MISGGYLSLPQPLPEEEEFPDRLSMKHFLKDNSKNKIRNSKFRESYLISKGDLVIYKEKGLY
jgi:hypothetical protein